MNWSESIKLLEKKEERITADLIRSEKEDLEDKAAKLERELEEARTRNSGFGVRRKKSNICYNCGRVGHISKYWQEDKNNKHLSNYIVSQNLKQKRIKIFGISGTEEI